MNRNTTTEFRHWLGVILRRLSAALLRTNKCKHCTNGIQVTYIRCPYCFDWSEEAPYHDL